MHRFFKFVVLATMGAMSPAWAQSEQTSEWWLVLDERNAQSAHFVDLASMSRSGQTIEVAALIMDRSGNRKVTVMNVDCSDMSGGEPAVTSFVCGNEEYRTGNGLILGMVSPDEMAQMLFATQSGGAPTRGF